MKHQEECDAHLKLQEQLSTEQATCAELRRSLVDAEARHATECATLLTENAQLSARLSGSMAAIADLARKQMLQADELCILRAQLVAAGDEVAAAKTQNDDLAAQLTSSNQQHELAVQQAQVWVPLGVPTSKFQVSPFGSVSVMCMRFKA